MGLGKQTCSYIVMRQYSQFCHNLTCVPTHHYGKQNSAVKNTELWEKWGYGHNVQKLYQWHTKKNQIKIVTVLHMLNG